jgi:hypothetical protein
MPDSTDDGARGGPARGRQDREMDKEHKRTFANGDVVQTPHVGEIARGSGRCGRAPVRARGAYRIPALR